MSSSSNPNGKRVFISYARRDSRKVSRLVEILRHGGHHPWRDEEQLRGGENWQDALRREIEHCDVFVYALTPRSLKSQWCNWEFSQAVRLGKPVVPVKLSRVEMSGILASLHYVDLSNYRNPVSAVDLVNAIQTARVSILPGDAPDIAEPDEHLRAVYLNEERMGIRRLPLLALGAIVMVVAILALLLLVGGGNIPDFDDEVTLTIAPTKVVDNYTPTATTPPPTVTTQTTTAAPIEPATTEIITASSLPAIGVPLVTAVPATETEEQPPSETPTVMPSPTSTPDTAVDGVVLYQANLRNGPGPIYAQVGYVGKNEAVRIEGQNGLRDWYRLVERTDDGHQKWIWSQNVRVEGDAAPIPVVDDYPDPPSVVSVSTLCNPGQWFGVCGSNGCETEYVSQCNDAGTGYVCVWNPGQCSSGQPSSPFRPTIRTGGGIVSCTCTQSWLENLIRQNGYDIADLIPSWDLDHDGAITCEDYKLQTGSYTC